MDIQECYAQMEGDYDDALGRLRKDERIVKYLKKFEASSEFEPLCEAVAAKDWEAAFRTSHTMKGVALNLGITKLGLSSSALCEMVRHGDPTGDIYAALETVKADYAQTIAAINELE